MERLERWAGKKVVVVGDLILDRYLHGAVERISPEAPVPVVRLDGQESRPGGAANVAANVVALGAEAHLVASIGGDEPGQELRRALGGLGIGCEGVLDSERPTTVKTRVLARHQQIVRFDHEDDAPIDRDGATQLVTAAREALAGASALVVSDYAKGLLGPWTLPPLLEAAREEGVPVVVDPKVRHFELYAGATVITPNQFEAARATAMEIRDEGQALASAQRILERLELEAVLLTRGEEGMLLVARDEEPRAIPAVAREVYDVTGAGDTVTAVLGVALAGGHSFAEAAWLANAAASLAVARLGTAAVSVDELGRLLAALDSEQTS